MIGKAFDIWSFIAGVGFGIFIAIILSLIKSYFALSGNH